MVGGGIWCDERRGYGGTLTCRYRLSPVSARSVRRRLLLPLSPSTLLDGAEEGEDEERASSGGIPSAESDSDSVSLLSPSCCFSCCSGCVWLTSLLMRTPSSNVSTSTLRGWKGID